MAGVQWMIFLTKVLLLSRVIRSIRGDGRVPAYFDRKLWHRRARWGHFSREFGGCKAVMGYF